MVQSCRVRSLLAILIFAFVPLLPATALAKDIHSEKSLYRNIVVRESAGRRCLVFAVKRGDRNQTCMDLQNPSRLVFPYVRMTFGGLLANSSPARMLVIGLGGGSIPITLSALFPQAVIDIVEADFSRVEISMSLISLKSTKQWSVWPASTFRFARPP